MNPQCCFKVAALSSVKNRAKGMIVEINQDQSATCFLNEVPQDWYQHYALHKNITDYYYKKSIQNHCSMSQLLLWHLFH